MPVSIRSKQKGRPEGRPFHYKITHSKLESELGTQDNRGATVTVSRRAAGTEVKYAYFSVWGQAWSQFVVSTENNVAEIVGTRFSASTVHIVDRRSEVGNRHLLRSPDRFCLRNHTNQRSRSFGSQANHQR